MKSRIRVWYAMAINSFSYIRYKSPLILNAWVNVKNGCLNHNNWGDDINFYLLEKIAGKKVIFRNKSLLHRLLPFTNYICIGSILGWYENKNAIIWGAGFIDKDKKLRCVPKKIVSVRGKLSRDLILSQGISCPEEYGDPALLVSQYYTPLQIKFKYELGIVTHFMDASNPYLLEFIKSNSNCIIIDLVNYKKWTDVIDEILSCKKIVSSSLHGLIVSDSYKIPNRWVSFSDQIAGGTFKFLDYFSSVNREETVPISIQSISDLVELYQMDFGVCNANINFNKLFENCSFIEYKNE